MKKRESSCIIGEIVNWCNHCGKQYGCSSKIKNRNTIGSSNSTGYLLRETKTLIQKDKCIPMFTAALFAIAKIESKPSIHR